MDTLASSKEAKSFYQSVLTLLTKHKFHFMVGGAFALYEYTGVHRKTKDLDIFCLKTEFPDMLKILSDAGYKTELTEAHWIAKAYDKKDFVDFIFADPYEFYSVDESWLNHAPSATILGHKVKLIPPEEMLISKMYRQRRTKYEGPDITHTILRKGRKLDWRRIATVMNPHWELLLAHILNFWFVYPSEKDCIPKRLIENLIDKAKKELNSPTPVEKISRGLILSQKEYEIDITEWGFRPVINNGK